MDLVLLGSTHGDKGGGRLRDSGYSRAAQCSGGAAVFGAVGHAEVGQRSSRARGQPIRGSAAGREQSRSVPVFGVDACFGFDVRSLSYLFILCAY